MSLPVSEPDPDPPWSENQARAALKLLGDPDRSVAQMVLDQILGGTAQAETRLRHLLGEASGSARDILLEGLRRLLERQRWQALHDRCLHLDTLAEFEDFCWKLALWHDPDAALDDARAFMDRCAETIRIRASDLTSDLDRVGVLASVLHKEEGLTGNADQYYTPDNSFLDSVVLTRQGIPLSLTALYIFIGARAGLKVDGIGMPEHFLARLGDVYFDPFHGGRVLDQDKLRIFLQQRPEPNAHRFLEPMPCRLMAQRMVRNLIYAFTRVSNTAKADALREILIWTE